MGKNAINFPPELGRLFVEMAIIDGANGVLLANSPGVTGLVKNATGEYAISLNRDVGGAMLQTAETLIAGITPDGSAREYEIEVINDAGAATDTAQITVFFFVVPTSFVNVP